jgi:hypothetical protein
VPKTSVKPSQSFVPRYRATALGERLSLTKGCEITSGDKIDVT